MSHKASSTATTPRLNDLSQLPQYPRTFAERESRIAARPRKLPTRSMSHTPVISGRTSTRRKIKFRPTRMGNKQYKLQKSSGTGVHRQINDNHRVIGHNYFVRGSNGEWEKRGSFKKSDTSHHNNDLPDAFRNGTRNSSKGGQRTIKMVYKKAVSTHKRHHIQKTE
jgi:hypothetical protein